MMNKSGRQRLIKHVVYLLIALCTCIGVSELVRDVPAIAGFNKDWVDVNTRHNGLTGIGYFIGMAAVLTAIGLPRQVTAFLAGYAFGFCEGLIYSVVGATISCAGVFWLSRLFARKTISNKFSDNVAKLDAIMTVNPFLAIIAIRLMPVGNNLATNLIAGVSRIPARVFVSGSMIGYLPQMTIFALMGKGIVVQSNWKIILSVVMLGLSSLLGVYIYKRASSELLATSEMLADNPRQRHTSAKCHE